MEKHDAIADLLRSWRHDRHYVDAHGSPRVLPIRGKGASLETLARKFVPRDVAQPRSSRQSPATVRQGPIAVTKWLSSEESWFSRPRRRK